MDWDILFVDLVPGLDRVPQVIWVNGLNMSTQLCDGGIRFPFPSNQTRTSEEV